MDGSLFSPASVGAEQTVLVASCSRACYNNPCLAKQSWALLASNPTRDNQARAGE